MSVCLWISPGLTTLNVTYATNTPKLLSTAVAALSLGFTLWQRIFLGILTDFQTHTPPGQIMWLSFLLCDLHLAWLLWKFSPLFIKFLKWQGFLDSHLFWAITRSCESNPNPHFTPTQFSCSGTESCHLLWPGIYHSFLIYVSPSILTWVIKHFWQNHRMSIEIHGLHLRWFCTQGISRWSLEVFLFDTIVENWGHDIFFLRLG